MISCPICNRQVEILEKHLGALFTCPHCRSVYYLNLSGQPEVAQLEPEVEVETIQGEDIESTLPPEVIEYEDLDNSNQFSSENSSLQQTAEFDSNGGIYMGDNNFPDASEFEEPLSNDVSSEYESFDDPQMNQDFGPVLGQITPHGDSVDHPESFFKSTQTDSSDFSDVLGFGNSDTTSGILKYIVVIEGLDVAKTVRDLKEAMQDSRFGWEVSEVLSQVNRGRLVITDLSPAKAFVLINRIKYLPLKISWRQDVLSNS